MEEPEPLGAWGVWEPRKRLACSNRASLKLAFSKDAPSRRAPWNLQSAPEREGGIWLGGGAKLRESHTSRRQGLRHKT